MNNGKYYSESYQLKQQEKVDRQYGPIDKHEKECERCGTLFEWEGRRYTKAYEKARFCSRSCAADRSEWWRDNVTTYRSICLVHWDKSCAICGFDKIIEVHHIDENKQNNDPQNLIPLCPNHHQMVHSGYRSEVQPEIDRLVGKKWLDNADR